MKSDILIAVRLTVVCVVFFCIIYPLFILGIAQLTPDKGMGATVTKNNKTWFSNIGQNFADDKYFSSRPSAVSYNAAGSGASNKGPSNPEYLAQVQARIDTFLVHNPGVNKSEIPAELVTSSGSGLDPDLSVYGASVQIKRIAKARNIPETVVQEAILKNTEKPFLNLFGPEKVNVLRLNLELEK